MLREPIYKGLLPGIKFTDTHLYSGLGYENYYESNIKIVSLKDKTRRPQQVCLHLNPDGLIQS